MRSARSITAVLAAAGLALTLSACSSSNDTAADNTAYCASSASLQTEINDLRTMVATGTATLNQVNDQRHEVQTAYAKAYSDAADLTASVKVAIEGANRAFEAALDAIPNDATVNEAELAYRSAVAAYDTAIDAIRVQVGC